jgi:hypothetical protein
MMAIQNAQINIEKTHEEIPKDTAYEFSFQIIKPNYGDQEISRRAETKENPLGEGLVYEIDLNKDKFVQINEAGTSTQAKFLIKDGLDYYTVGADEVRKLLVSSVDETTFEKDGFSDGLFVGIANQMASMSNEGAVGEGQVYSKKIPTYFVDIDGITVEEA